jgi:hypothetical protein
MDPLFLVAALAAGFVVQRVFDTRVIAGVAIERHWSVLRITWAPLARFLSGNKWERCYWLRYRDEDGNDSRRMARITGLLGLGASVVLDPASVERVERRTRGPRAIAAPRSAFSRTGLTLLCAFGGAWVGAAIGILGSFALYPGSNIAPAYGVILVTPAGILAGGCFGFLRSR